MIGGSFLYAQSPWPYAWAYGKQRSVRLLHLLRNSAKAFRGESARDPRSNASTAHFWTMHTASETGWLPRLYFYLRQSIRLFRDFDTLFPYTLHTLKCVLSYPRLHMKWWQRQQHGEYRRLRALSVFPNAFAYRMWPRRWPPEWYSYVLLRSELPSDTF